MYNRCENALGKGKPLRDCTWLLILYETYLSFAVEFFCPFHSALPVAPAFPFILVVHVATRPKKSAEEKKGIEQGIEERKRAIMEAKMRSWYSRGPAGAASIDGGSTRSAGSTYTRFGEWAIYMLHRRLFVWTMNTRYLIQAFYVCTILCTPYTYLYSY